MMKKYLLDTHALLWYLEANPLLSQKAKDILEAICENIQVLGQNWLAIN